MRRVEFVIKKLLEHRFLILIVILAAILRFYKLPQVPPSLNWDEVSHGYNAYSILKTGKDEWGQFLPTIFRAYGDYKLPVYIYSTSISILIFGLNAFAVRLPSALAGIGTVIFTYLLTAELFRGQKETIDSKLLALLSSLLVAIEPWSLFLSRGAFEANMAFTFITAGVYFFLRGVRHPGARRQPAIGSLKDSINRFTLSRVTFVISALFFGLSVWTYNSARIFAPIFVLFLLLLYKKPLKKIFVNEKLKIIISGIILLIFFIPMAWQLASSSGQARYEKVSILDQGAITEINNSRNDSNFPPFLARVVHNKVTYFTPKLLGNWALHYSGEFLYFKGGDNYQFSIPGYGILYPLNATFLIIGVLVLLKSMKKGYRSSAVVLFWFFTGSIASSLTREAPHVLRSITMLPTPMIITGAGLLAVARFLNRKWKSIVQKHLIVIYLLGIIFCVGRYLNIYFTEYPESYSQSWQYGNQQMVEYVTSKYMDVDKIVITKKYGEPHEFLLFFLKWDPESFQNDPNLLRFEQSDWYWVDRFDKFYFVNDWQINEEGTDDYVFSLESRGEVDCLPGENKCLLVTSYGNAPLGWVKTETINFLDGSTAYEIYEN